MVLFINACVRRDSRTKRLAHHLLAALGSDIKEIVLNETEFPKVDEAFLIKRDGLIQRHEYDDPLFDMARIFASADVIVIAVPFWDLSFPSTLKQYFEQINVLGITFSYTDEGIPKGLCRAKKLFYVTSAGGTIYNDEYGYGYVKALAQSFYGISDVQLIKAEGLDINGADTEEILCRAESEIDSLFDNND